jgi:hypothetical protein
VKEPQATCHQQMAGSHYLSCTHVFSRIANRRVTYKQYPLAFGPE